MTSQLRVEQDFETAPAQQSGNPPPAKTAGRAKAEKEDSGVWPRKLKGALTSNSSIDDLEFSGRIEKVSIKETGAGHHVTSFTMMAKNGGSRSYEIGANDIGHAALVLAAFAGKRKVRIATAPGDGGPARIVEIEARR